MGPKVRVAARFAAKTRKRAAIGSLADIASIGSAVALVIFTMITAAHLRIRAETGASLPVLVLAIVAAGAVFVTFVFTTLIHEPASMLGEFILAVLTQMDAFNRVLGTAQLNLRQWAWALVPALALLLLWELGKLIARRLLPR
jgi:hypothetical protein